MSVGGIAYIVNLRTSWQDGAASRCESLRARHPQINFEYPHYRLPSMKIVEITREPVELYKILKFEGLVTTGGEAKLLIGDGQVTVNGAVETRRRRKMVSGDVIEFRGDQLEVRLV